MSTDATQVRPFFRVLAALLAVLFIAGGLVMFPVAWDLLRDERIGWVPVLAFATAVLSIAFGILFAFAAVTGRSSPRREPGSSPAADTKPPSQAAPARRTPYPQAPAVEEFLAQVLAGERVWTLTSSTGWLTFPSASSDTSRVHPFWSHPRLCEQWAKGQSLQSQPAAIPLESFTDEWLPPMADDGLLVGINWAPGSEQLEGNPLVLRDELKRRHDSAA